uniref:Ring finger protein 228 n=1 Tax=Kryptolebias marmoratus TaxID=37003 RepID=A0A3Q3BPJ2_KRYMA
LVYVAHIRSVGTQTGCKEEYECKICYNGFDLDRRVPKLLSCSHTFCQECLEVLHSREGGGWRVGCPVCRHRTPVREYKVQNLPNNGALSEELLLRDQTNSSEAEPRTGGPAAPPASAPQPTRESCERAESCKRVAFTAGCACAVLSFFSVVLLLLVGLVFMHNFKHTAVGPVCMIVASVLALFSLTLTWLMCILKDQGESQTPSLPTSNVT